MFLNEKNCVALCLRHVDEYSREKMKEAAAAAGKDYEIAAYSASEAATKAADADAVLLGPQIRFSKDKIAAELPGVPVEAIDMRMYGRMDGKGTVELAEKIMKG